MGTAQCAEDNCSCIIRGSDDLPTKIIKELAYELSIDVLNVSVFHGIVPAQRKKANFVSFPKQILPTLQKLKTHISYPIIGKDS